ncbi:MAG TPA: hypothetical protein VFD82_10815 [Planctomycetota bacterium]|nr:hypothetical protein [Planctomycetota bacterium]
MLLPRSLLAVAALAAASIAQTVVLPTSAATTGGSAQNTFPWGTPATAWPGLRIMCIYDSSHFTGATPPITTPILITSISWRANDVSTTTSWVGGIYNSATLRLATAAVDYTLASTTWAANLGPDQRIVHNGPVTVSGGTGAGVGVPGPYHVTIPVVPPFLYDPNLGDLVVDTDYLSPGNYVGGSQVAMDLHLPGVNGSRVYASSNYPNANFIDNGCPVIQVAFAPSGGTLATNTGLGTGCVRSNTSFYEFFATPAAFDLDNTGLTMIPTGLSSYLVLNSGALLPVGSIATPVSLALGDDAEVTQTFTTGSFPSATSFNICSNGFVSIGSNGTSFNPDVFTFLNATNTAWRSWHDFDPTIPGSGQVKYEESAAAIVVTWDGVWDYGGTSALDANTMQMQFYPSGQVTFAWGLMSHLGTTGHLVGYSPGGNSLDPGSTNLSALGASAITLSSTDALPLVLTAMTRPVLGTNWNLTTSQIPATGVLGVDIFGVSDPGVLDLFFVGMPTCQLRSTLDVLSAWLVGGATHNYSFAVPATPTSLIGFSLFTQSVVFQVPPVNPFGAITSNGVRGTLGDV